MATIDAAIQQVIDNALATATTHLQMADAAINASMTASQGYASTGAFLEPFTPSAIEPDVPYVADATLTYDANLARLIQLLSDQLANYYTLYYPLTSDAFGAATSWLVNTITVGGTGFSPAVEAQIWQRGRTRVITEGKRVEAQSMSEFANRGFTIPPGALVGKLQENRFEQMSKINQLSTDVAIKQAEIEIENIKFAVAEAIKSRLAAMQTATDYIRALMSAPDAAARIALINSEARAKMVSATADLYRARLTRDELVLRSSNADQDARVQMQKISTDAFYEGVKNRVQASVAAATAYGNAANAALGSLNTVTSATQVLF